MLSTPSRRLRARGFSSMEVLAGLGVTLILLAAVYTFQQAQTKAFLTQQVYSESQNVTRSVIDLMARELRMACYDPGTALSPSPAPCQGVEEGIIEATPTRIHFQQDLNGDNVIGAPGEDVTYDVSNGNILRTDGAAAPAVLASGVPTGGLGFLYFGIDGSQIVPGGSPAALNQCQRDSVLRVRITVRANLSNPAPRISTPIASVAETEVAVRNRSVLANF